MISKITKLIIGFLLRRIYEVGYNVNQLARELGISVSRAHEIVTDLKSRSMLRVINLKTAIYYSLDLTNPDTRDLCKILIREEQRDLKPIIRTYAEELKKFEDSLFTVIFGSILRKSDFRDVDVLFITDNVKDVNTFCISLSKIRVKPVDPLIMTKKDFISNIKKKDGVVLDILKNGKVIKGEDYFVEALKDGQN
jgi:predicted nucleotidyltransferase